MAMAMAMAGKQKNEFWRELRHKSGCCCFGWAVYAPWACYMNLRTLYVSKLAKCPLICLGDLVGDRGLSYMRTRPGKALGLLATVQVHA